MAGRRTVRSGAGKRRSTISDVAREAGVSVATVSYVLNDRPGVGDETRMRVQETAQRMDYRVNRLASGLRGAGTHVLGLLLADIANPFYPDLARGVIDDAHAIGRGVLIAHTGEDGERHDLELRRLLDQQVDGVIATSLIDGDAARIRAVAARGVAVVQAVRRLEGVPLDFVGIDDERAGRDAVRHLLELGHREIALISGPRASSASRARARGFHAELAAAGCAPPPRWRLESALEVDAGHAAGARLLAAGERPPTAVVCANDLVAMGVIDAVMAGGWSVPDDVSVLGFDDIKLAGSQPVGLSTVHQPREEIGRTAVRLLHRRLTEPNAPVTERLLPHRVIGRRSCGPPTRR